MFYQEASPERHSVASLTWRKVFIALLVDPTFVVVVHLRVVQQLLVCQLRQTRGRADGNAGQGMEAAQGEAVCVEGRVANDAGHSGERCLSLSAMA